MVHIAAHQGNIDCLKVFAGLENAVEIFKVQDKVRANDFKIILTVDINTWGFIKCLHHHFQIMTGSVSHTQQLQKEIMRSTPNQMLQYGLLHVSIVCVQLEQLLLSTVQNKQVSKL